MNEPRVRLTDRRLLIIFVLLVALLACVGTYVKSTADSFAAFRRSSVAACEASRSNTQAFNDFIGRLQATTLGSPLLSSSEKAQRVAFYQEGKQAVPSCPPARGPIETAKTSTPPPPPPTKGIAGP